MGDVTNSITGNVGGSAIQGGNISFGSDGSRTITESQRDRAVMLLERLAELDPETASSARQLAAELRGT